jgi:hypothetical protein
MSSSVGTVSRDPQSFNEPYYQLNLWGCCGLAWYLTARAIPQQLHTNNSYLAIDLAYLLAYVKVISVLDSDQGRGLTRLGKN